MYLLREDKGRVVYGLTGNIHGARGTGTVRITTIRNASDNASEQFALVCKANFVVAGYRADTNENIAVVVHLQPDTSGNGIGIYIPSSTLSEMSSDATLYLVLDSILLSESHLSGFIANNNGCT